MARGRMINNAIAADKRIHELSDDTSRLAFTWLVTFADCEGRTHGDPAMVRSMVFPRRTDITAERVAAYIQEWHDAGLIQWYEADGDRWIEFPAFDKNQIGLRKDREPDSVIPPSPTTADIQQDDGEHPSDIPPKRTEPKRTEENRTLAADAAPQPEPEPEKPKRKPTKRDTCKAELEAHFIAVAGILKPAANTAKQKSAAAVRWWNPLGEIANLVDDDVGRGRELVTEAVERMRAEKLTVAAPQSILANCQSIYGEWQSKNGRKPQIGVPEISPGRW